jgi:hypothetical protein
MRPRAVRTSGLVAARPRSSKGKLNTHCRTAHEALDREPHELALDREAHEALDHREPGEEGDHRAARAGPRPRGARRTRPSTASRTRPSTARRTRWPSREPGEPTTAPHELALDREAHELAVDHREPGEEGDHRPARAGPRPRGARGPRPRGARGPRPPRARRGDHRGARAPPRPRARRGRRAPRRTSWPSTARRTRPSTTARPARKATTAPHEALDHRAPGEEGDHREAHKALDHRQAHEAHELALDHRQAHEALDREPHELPLDHREPGEEGDHRGAGNVPSCRKGDTRISKGDTRPARSIGTTKGRRPPLTEGRPGACPVTPRRLTRLERARSLRACCPARAARAAYRRPINRVTAVVYRSRGSGFT